MRSILKSHKRNDSSVSDSFSPLEGSTNKTPVLRSSNSPTFQQLVKMTPPANALGLQQLAKSSPKKLLTPIKKMFGHHPKTAVAPTSTETLQAIINGDMEPPRDYRFGRQKQNSFPDLSELRTRDHSTSRDTSLLASLSRHQRTSLQNTSIKSADFKLESHSVKDKDGFNNQSGGSSLPKLTQIETGIHSASFNASDISLATSKNGFYVSHAIDDVAKISRETSSSSSSEEYLKDSDTSSQFSFVKDNRGGRNTSIKYYKTKPKNAAEDVGPSNYFSIDDTRFDADAVSDYDYENNGISDVDEFDDGFPGSTNRYGELFSDRDSFEAMGIPKTPKILAFHLSCPNQTPLLSAGCSDIGNAFDVDEINPQTLPMSDLRSPGYAGDFLDTYLESRLPVNHVGSTQMNSSTPNEDHQNSSKNVTQELGLGLGIGMQNVYSNDGESVHSVTNMMDTLRKLEGSPGYEGTKRETILTSHNVAQDPTKNLNQKRDANGSYPKESLEVEESSNGKNRQSVADMMAKLSMLGNMDKYHEENKIKETPEEHNKAPNKEKQRYSWFSNEDSYGRSETGHHSGFEDALGDGLSFSMDEDLLDEINLIPENFDFNDEDQRTPELDTSNFLRSNSYNKKPKKMSMDFNFQEQKINLRNKTVTFYRSKSLDRDKPQNIPHPTRATSLKSVTSFNDEDISEGEEEDYHESKDSSIDQLLHTSFYAHPNNLIAQKSASLEPITESDTPKLT